ncbi:hypothetical protein HYS00_00445 [Candidatus Microgenomates bacterium]|nr:hypothetical protein [Candidatus Microgenomates bacterium]
MNTDKMLAGLSMDLARVSMGYRRGSDKMADRFCDEARARCMELRDAELQSHVQKIIVEILHVMEGSDKMAIAEKSLMYSKLIQNYVTHGSLEDQVN